VNRQIDDVGVARLKLDYEVADQALFFAVCFSRGARLSLRDATRIRGSLLENNALATAPGVQSLKKAFSLPREAKRTLLDREQARQIAPFHHAKFVRLW